MSDEEEQYEPGVLYWHEALDRAHVARDHFFEYVEQHPVVMNDEELRVAAENVGVVMGQFYQLVGAKYHEFEENNPDPVKAELVEALKDCREALRYNLSKYAYKNEPIMLSAFNRAEEALKKSGSE